MAFLPVTITDQAYQMLRAKAVHAFDGREDRQLANGCWEVSLDNEVIDRLDRMLTTSPSYSDALIRLCTGGLN